MTTLTENAPAAGGAEPARPSTHVITYQSAQGEALVEEMRRDTSVFCMGQDLRMGGVFGGTRGMVDEFGYERVLDTSITEAFMVGCAAGAAMTGMRPVVQMGFADFSLIAGDEIFQKLGKWRHMHGGQFERPAVIVMPIGPSGGAGPEHSGSAAERTSSGMFRSASWGSASGAGSRSVKRGAATAGRSFAVCAQSVLPTMMTSASGSVIRSPRTRVAVTESSSPNPACRMVSTMPARSA